MKNLDIKKKIVTGSIISVSTQSFQAGIQICSTIILARLLSPRDYGIYGMVLAVILFLGIFWHLGLGSASVQKSDITNQQKSNLFWLSCCMGLILTLLLIIAAPLVAHYYKEPELYKITIALAFVFVIASAGDQHLSQLTHDMRFGRKACATISGAIVSLAVSIALALYGFKYWALVWGNIIGTMTSTLMVMNLSGFKPQLPAKVAGTRQLIIFGLNITALNIIKSMEQNIDKIVIGKAFGAESLGLYTRGYQLASLPNVAISTPIQTVAFSALSKLQNNPEKFKSTHYTIIQTLCWVIFPIVLYITLNHETLIQLLLGEKWIGVSPVFAILSVYLLLQSIYGKIGLVPLCLGDSKRYLYCGIINSASIICAILAGAGWGIIGISIAMMMNSIIIFPFASAYALKNSACSVRSCCKAFLGPFIASAIVAAIYLLTGMNANTGSQISDVILSILIYLVMYSTISSLFTGFRKIMTHTFQNLAGLIRK